MSLKPPGLTSTIIYLFILIGGAAAFFVWGAISYNDQQTFRQRTLSAPGIVSDTRDVSDSDGTSYQISIQFQTPDGRKVSFYRYTSDATAYTKNQAITVYYDSSNPNRVFNDDNTSLWRNDWLWKMLGGLGLLLWAFRNIVGYLRATYRYKRLTNFGQPVLTRLVKIKKTSSYGDYYYTTFSTWANPQSGKVYNFKSDTSSFDPQPAIDAAGGVVVQIDPQDPRNYFVDTQDWVKLARQAQQSGANNAPAPSAGWPSISGGPDDQPTYVSPSADRPAPMAYPPVQVKPNLALGGLVQSWLTWLMIASFVGFVGAWVISFLFNSGGNVIAGSATIFSGSNPASIPTALPKLTPAVGKVGETVTQNGYSITVKGVERTPTDGNSFDVDGYEYVLLNLTYVSGGETNLSSSLFSSGPTLRDNANFVYPFASSLSSSVLRFVKKADLSGSSVALHQGDKADGWLAFQVPRAAQGLVLDYPIKDPKNSSTLAASLRVVLDNAPLAAVSLVQPVGTSGKVNDTVGAGPYLLTVDKVETTRQLATGRNNNVITPSASNEQLVAVEVIFESAADGTTFNDTNITLKDGQNYRYQNKSYKYPRLSFADNLAKGAKVRGWLTFSVPASATGLVLEYQPTNAEKVLLQVALNQ